MKLVFQVMIFVCLLAATGATYVYFSILRPAHRLLVETKPVAVARAQALLACVVAGELPACADLFTSPQFRTLYPPELLTALASDLRAKMGGVKSSRVDDQTFTAMEKREPGGGTVVVSFSLLVTLENSATVPVLFELEKQGAGPFLVTHLALPPSPFSR
jgi:hypothetical protein